MSVVPSRIPLLGAPTASGKSAAALALAAALRGEARLEIVSADAMQVYRGMDIGTAKPDASERALVPHHLLDVVTPAEPFSVATFVQLAEAAIRDVLERGGVPLVVGGTGFYLRALSEGLPTVPTADPAAQAELWRRYEAEGLEPLERELAAAAPADAERAQRNPRRVIRALEILRRTGRPPSSFPRAAPAFSYSKLVLLPRPEQLLPRIEARARAMFEAGLVEEVEGLLERYPRWLTATQAIGYKEVVAHLRGELTVEEAEREVVAATARYARRQLTWFRREPRARALPGLAREFTDELTAWVRASVGEPRPD